MVAESMVAAIRLDISRHASDRYSKKAKLMMAGRKA
jgi:hypothetical protein